MTSQVIAFWPRWGAWSLHVHPHPHPRGLSRCTGWPPRSRPAGSSRCGSPRRPTFPPAGRPPWPGGDLPEWYKRTCDPLLALTAAAVTTRLRVGTGILLAALRDPVILAKELATLDWLSGGRLELGVAYGWNAEEAATHGVDLADAPAILADTLALAQALWNDDEASYRGRHATVEPCWSWPKPIQRPRPPVHYGGRASAALFHDIARHGDGWIPIEGYGTVTPHLDRLRAAFDDAGRDPADEALADWLPAP